MVPSLAIPIAGSLSPSGRSKALLEKVKLPEMVPASAETADRVRTTKITTSKILRIRSSAAESWRMARPRLVSRKWLREKPQLGRAINATLAEFRLSRNRLLIDCQATRSREVAHALHAFLRKLGDLDLRAL